MNYNKSLVTGNPLILELELFIWRLCHSSIHDYFMTRVELSNEFYYIYNSVTVFFLCFAKLCLSHRLQKGSRQTSLRGITALIDIHSTGSTIFFRSIMKWHKQDFYLQRVSKVSNGLQLQKSLQKP